MKLKNIAISGFRSIQYLPELELGSPTVLAGHNDAGKSAIIHSIMFLLGGYSLTDSDRTFSSNPDESVRLNAEGKLQRVTETYVAGKFVLSSQESQVFGAANLNLRRILREGEKVALEVLTLVPKDPKLRDLESLTVKDLEDRLKTLGLDASKGAKPELLDRLVAEADIAPKVEEWIQANAAIEKALPEGRRFDATSAVDADVAIKDTLNTKYRSHLESEGLKGSVREIEQELEALLVTDAEDMREHIVDRVNDIGAVEIRPLVNFTSANGLKNTSIQVRNQAGEEIDLQLSGAGRARRVALAIWEYNATLLASSGEDVVLLYDEPDTHLDYGHQRELITLIHQQTVNPKVTVVIASHSMNLIDGTDISDVVHVKHEAHRTVIERLTDDSMVGSHLGAIAASVGLRNTVLLHERLFVGVEGESEARVLPVLFKLATGRHLESCGIAVWPCGNNEGARRFAEFLHKHNRNVVFLVDEDSKTNSKHVFGPDKLRSVGLDPNKQCFYVGDPNEIEEVFTDEQWAEAANVSWARTVDDCSPWTPDRFRAHRGGKFSKDILDMVRSESEKAPSGKPDMLVGLVLNLRNAEDVPVDLREKFQRLVELSS